MAEWSKALVLGTSHFGGAGSNPVPVMYRVLRTVRVAKVTATISPATEIQCQSRLRLARRVDPTNTGSACSSPNLQ